MKRERSTAIDGNGAGPAPEDRTRVLVTGAAGFIGSHLCERLLEDGARIWGLDNFDDFYPPELKRRNVAGIVRRPNMHLVEGDVRDLVLLDGLMSDVPFDAVIHLAGRPGGPPSIQNPELCYDVNVRGTLTLLEALARHNVPTLLFGSSASVYGESEELPFREDAAADRPVSTHAASKRSAELLCHAHHRMHDVTVYCLRLFTVFGPRQRPDLAIHRFARHMRDGEPLPLYGGGSASRDYTYVDDVVNGIVLALRRAQRRDGDEAEYRIVNLGSQEAVGLRELVDALSDAMGIPAKVEHLPEQPGDRPATLASVDRARELLGYEPRVGLEEGLARFVSWLEETEDPVAVDTRVSDGSAATSPSVAPGGPSPRP